MKIPFIYTIRNFRARKLTSAITIAGIALVVFVFTAVLMMAYGVEKTLVATGSPDNYIIVREGSNGEISSIIDGETQNVIRSLPHIKTGSDGVPAMSFEPVVVINLDKSGGGMSNVTVRGVSPTVLSLREQVEIREGRMFNPDLRELIVGESIAERFPDATLGGSIKVAGNQWRIVGLFASGGSGYDSEIWGDSRQLLDAFNRENTVSSITFKIDDPANLAAFEKAFATELRLSEFAVKSESDYFAEQSESLALFIRFLGIFITVIFSVCAIVGAMITIYTAVANRTVEIGALRALGFSRASILTVFLAESLLIAIVGGAIGIALASFLQFFSISALNFDSFAELAFSFALSPSIIISSMFFAVMMGIAGGFLPSVRAARLKIVDALRTG